MYGYARVSTQEQVTNAQTDALHAAGVVVIFEEKRSGADRRRPVLTKLLHQVSAGDCIVVYKLDRIARSTRHFLQVMDELQERGVKFKSLTESLDTSSPSGRMIMQVLAAFAEFELSMIQERTRAGLHAAMARGSKPGRPRALSEVEEAEAVQRWRTGSITKTALAHEYGTHISSIKRAIRRANVTRELFEEQQ